MLKLLDSYKMSYIISSLLENAKGLVNHKIEDFAGDIDYFSDCPLL